MVNNMAWVFWHCEYDWGPGQHSRDGERASAEENLQAKAALLRYVQEQTEYSHAKQTENGKTSQCGPSLCSIVSMASSRNKTLG